MPWNLRNSVKTRCPGRICCQVYPVRSGLILVFLVAAYISLLFSNQPANFLSRWTEESFETVGSETSEYPSSSFSITPGPIVVWDVSIWKYPYEYLLQPSISSSKIDLVIFVTTRPAATERRLTIRQTWAARFKNVANVVVIFLYGIKGKNRDGAYQRAQEENRRFGDVLMVDFQDNYRNLSLKTYLGFDYVLKTYPGAKFFFKVDDDVVLFADNILRYLSSQDSGKRQFHCDVKTEAGVVRDPKKADYLSKKQYPNDNFPAYCHGHAYIGTRKAVKSVLDFVGNLGYYFHIEDVLFGGIAAKAKNVELVNSNDWHRYRKNDVSGDFETILSVHYVRSSIADIWSKYMEFLRNQTLS